VTPALQGVRVLDVSTVLAAPVAETMLGDFGAEVVKMEQPTVGDMTRRRAKQPGGREPRQALRSTTHARAHA